MSVKSVLAGAAVALSVFATGAQAAVITFDAGTTPSTTLLTVGDGGSEDGFDYVAEKGTLFYNSFGNPGHDMEGSYQDNGGVLAIRAQDGSNFTFQTVDYSVYGDSRISRTLTVTGWLNGDLVGTDLFSLAGTQNYTNTYDNWTLFGAENLGGLKIDTLRFNLSGGYDANSMPYYLNVDNVRLDAVSAVPEPATWAMMITGFGLAGAMLRRRRTGAFA